MRAQILCLTAASIVASSAAAALERRLDPTPGLCTIGMDAISQDIANPVGGTSQPIFNQYGWIVGTDGKQTDEPAYTDPNDGRKVIAKGIYGGLSGGAWTVEAFAAKADKLDGIVVSFTGRNDQPDQTLDSRNEPSNVCDCYSYGFPSVTSGCRCRFACQ